MCLVSTEVFDLPQARVLGQHRRRQLSDQLKCAVPDIYQYSLVAASQVDLDQRG
jgi:hypothetical protein